MTVVQLIDSSVYPATAAYLDTLGGDLDKYPRCEGKPDLYADIPELFPDLLQPGKVSLALKHRLSEPWLDRKWMPAVLGVCLNLMVRDTQMKNDEEFVTDVGPGVSLNIELGTHFQFRNAGNDDLCFIIVTTPNWPGEQEAVRVGDYWQTS